MEQTTSPLPKKEPKLIPTLDFSQAIKEVIGGKKIHRLEWEDKEYYCFINDSVLVLHKPDNKNYQWVLSIGDLMALDWIII